jgi:hypothetical protein
MGDPGPESLAFEPHLIEELDPLLQPLPRLERQYFLFGEPISTAQYAGLHEDREACFARRREVQGAIQTQIEQLREVREADPERYPIQRLLHRISARLG